MQSGFARFGTLRSGTIPSILISGSIPSRTSVRGFVKELKSAMPIILSKESSRFFATPPFPVNVVFSGQFCASHSRAFVSIFANLIAFENVELGGLIPPP